MIETAAAIALGAALVAALLFHLSESRAWRAERASLIATATEERSRLLDRIMARSYTDYVYTQTTATVETPQMTTDEAEAAWHEQNKKAHPEMYPDDVAA